MAGYGKATNPGRRRPGFARSGTAVVTALVLAACGGSGTKPPSSSTSTRTNAQFIAPAGTVKSSDGSFATTVPTGFTDETSSAHGGAVKVLYLAVGPRIDNQTININVFREAAAGRTDINAITAAELTGVRALMPHAHSFSPVSALTVGGALARSVDYQGLPGDQLLHLRQVFVLHGGWIYTITYTALPNTYQAHVGAVDELIGRWIWS